jgi:NCS2 family nucleobase:cation symporter-2
MGATLVPKWISYVFTYSGNNKGLIGLIDAIELVMTTGFVVTGFIALILNLVMSEEDDHADKREVEAEDKTVDSNVSGVVDGAGVESKTKSL